MEIRRFITLFTKYIYELKNADLFYGISQAQILHILQHLSAYLKTYQMGEIICEEGSTFHDIGILVSGKIQYKKNYLTGDCLTLKLIEAPESFGEDEACTHAPAAYTLCALEASTVIFIPGDHLLFMDTTSSIFMGPFLINLVRLIAKRSATVQSQVNYGRITSLKKRVATFLLENYKATGQCLFTVQLNRCEMAAYLNATRPALSKVLSELKKEEIIDYYKDSFKIENLEALMKQ